MRMRICWSLRKDKLPDSRSRNGSDEKGFSVAVSLYKAIHREKDKYFPKEKRFSRKVLFLEQRNSRALLISGWGGSRISFQIHNAGFCLLSVQHGVWWQSSFPSPRGTSFLSGLKAGMGVEEQMLPLVRGRHQEDVTTDLTFELDPGTQAPHPFLVLGMCSLPTIRSHSGSCPKDLTWRARAWDALEISRRAYVTEPS